MINIVMLISLGIALVELVHVLRKRRAIRGATNEISRTDAYLASREPLVFSPEDLKEELSRDA